MFERLGGFDERFDAAEAARAVDADLGYRLLRAGYLVRFEPGRGQRHTAAAAVRQSRECGRAAVALVRKHPELAGALLGVDALGSGGLLAARRWGLAAPRLAGLAAAALAPLAVRRAAPGDTGASRAELLEAVRAASYWRGVAEAGGVPRVRPLRVLCYHAICDLAGDPVIERYGVPPGRFRDQLDCLRRAGYRFIHPDELVAYLDGRAGLPRRPLLVTFDDCYTDLLDEALPELLERGIPAVAFAVSGRSSNLWDQAAGARALPLLDARGLEALARSGVEIGAHSRTHRSLSAVDRAELAGETAGAAADLERAGLARPRLFAYPHGDWSPAVLREIERAGYAAAFTVTPGRVCRASGRYTLPRVDVRREHAGWRFRLRVALVAGGRLRRPARRLMRLLSRPGAGVAVVPALATLATLGDGLSGVLRLVS